MNPVASVATTPASTRNGSVVLVTGASSGIGQAVAVHLAGLGHAVWGTRRRLEGDQGAVRMAALDVTDDHSVESCVARVVAAEGRIDVLVNNAGAGLCGAVEDTTLEEARLQVETNFFGPVRLVRAVLPHMRRQGSGRLITIGSLAGLAALPFQPYYSASKFALQGLNEALRLELLGSGIDATMVNPGDFRTGFTTARVFAAAARSGANTAQLQKTLAVYERDENNGADATLVADLVARLVRQERVGVRYTVGRLDQRLGIWLKDLLPASLFEKAMKATYALR